MLKVARAADGTPLPCAGCYWRPGRLRWWVDVKLESSYGATKREMQFFCTKRCIKHHHIQVQVHDRVQAKRR